MCMKTSSGDLEMLKLLRFIGTDFFFNQKLCTMVSCKGTIQEIENAEFFETKDIMELVTCKKIYI